MCLIPTSLRYSPVDGQHKWDNFGMKLNGHIGACSCYRKNVEYLQKGAAMAQVTSDKFWQAEARSEQTKRLIRDIKRITYRKFTAEEKCAIAAVYSG